MPCFIRCSRNNILNYIIYLLSSLQILSPSSNGHAGNNSRRNGNNYEMVGMQNVTHENINNADKNTEGIPVSPDYV